MVKGASGGTEGSQVKGATSGTSDVVEQVR